jgi:uncharacterized LabA/DUF88 family protein
VIVFPPGRTVLFIDGPNLYATTRQLGFDIDYKRMLTMFREQGELVRAYYYTSVAASENYQSLRPLLDWLDYNGFSVGTKPVKEFAADARSRATFGWSLPWTP